MNRWWRYWACLLWAGTVGGLAWAGDNLDSLKGRGWSPNSQWFVFNPVNQDSLFIANINGRRNFVIRPVGQVVLDTSNLFASSPAKTNSASGSHALVGDGVTMTIGSPGHSKLEALEWSPNSEFLGYKYEKKMRAAFSVLDRTVIGTYGLGESLPWRKPDEWQVVFEFERSDTNHPSQYALRVVRPNNSLVKERLFRDERELQRISLLRNSGSSFLSPDRQRLIYPKRSEKGWQLVTETVTGTAEAQPLTESAPGAPYQWKLSHDGRTLAVVEGPTSLAVGPVDDWAKADRVAYSNLTLNVEWSPDDHYLACNDRQQLFLLEVAKDTRQIKGELSRVSDSCIAQFWGWRGTRLLFGDVTRQPADVFCFDTAGKHVVEQLITARHWESAPSVRTISPDGQNYICIVREVGGEGNLEDEVWKTKLEPGAQWELLDNLPPSESH
jgi:hypothetical protein